MCIVAFLSLVVSVLVSLSDVADESLLSSESPLSEWESSRLVGESGRRQFTLNLRSRIGEVKSECFVSIPEDLAGAIGMVKMGFGFEDGSFLSTLLLSLDCPWHARAGLW